MGVDEVYDTTFGADFTTIAESEEFLERLKNGGLFPMFTSCCPAWVKYLENENPKYLKNISTCKSPMEMVGAIFRDKYAEKDAQDGRTTYHIAIMPCTAKKMEAARPEFIHDGRPDVDLVLTTHEVIDMMQETGIQLNELELESPDLPFGLGSGAAVIYGTTGGVAEAVVRHCLPDKSKNALREISILGLRGDAPIKETTVTIGDTELKLAVVNGLANARKLLKKIDEGEAFYHLIEVMTCQGGCVGGAGQPYGLKATKEKRGDGLHQSDNAAIKTVRAQSERGPNEVQTGGARGDRRGRRRVRKGKENTFWRSVNKRLVHRPQIKAVSGSFRNGKTRPGIVGGALTWYKKTAISRRTTEMAVFICMPAFLWLSSLFYAPRASGHTALKTETPTERALWSKHYRRSAALFCGRIVWLSRQKTERPCCIPEKQKNRPEPMLRKLRYDPMTLSGPFLPPQE